MKKESNEQDSADQAAGAGGASALPTDVNSAASDGAAAAGAGLEDGPAANYFAGRSKRQKGGDVAGQGGQSGGGGLGLLLDRGRGAADARGVDDTMEFMEVKFGCVM